MANLKSAKKRARQAVKCRAGNTMLRSRANTFIKNARKAIEAGKQDEAKTAVIIALKEIDKMVPKGIFHKNKAARIKSRLNASLKKIAA